MAVSGVSRFSFELKGSTPLLMHADNVEAADTVKEWQTTPANKSISVPGDDRSPAWTWMTYLYCDEHGMVCMPADNLMVCLRQAGAQMSLKGNKTFKSVSQSGLLITAEALEFTNSGKRIAKSDLVAIKDEPFKVHKATAAKLGFDLLVKRAVVGAKKHVRVRPIFSAWTVRGTIDVLSSAITSEHLSQMFDLAGSVGLGDWRPGCKTPGRFGMFEAIVKKAK